MSITATVDRDTEYRALLIIETGAIYDIYGDSIAEMKVVADFLAEELGVTIEVYNWELPER